MKIADGTAFDYAKMNAQEQRGYDKGLVDAIAAINRRADKASASDEVLAVDLRLAAKTVADFRNQQLNAEPQ